MVDILRGLGEREGGGGVVHKCACRPGPSSDPNEAAHMRSGPAAVVYEQLWARRMLAERARYQEDMQAIRDAGSRDRVAIDRRLCAIWADLHEAYGTTPPVRGRTEPRKLPQAEALSAAVRAWRLEVAGPMYTWSPYATAGRPRP